MSVRRAARAALVGAAGVVLWFSSGAAAAGSTDLQQTTPLVDVMIWISVGGAIVTFALLVWSIWKFRDPKTKGRRYG